jgi:hypothetical protein
MNSQRHNRKRRCTFQNGRDLHHRLNAPCSKPRHVESLKITGHVEHWPGIMLMHIRPRIYCPFGDEDNHHVAVKLIELTLEPLGLYLRDGVELATGRPYPNKSYVVASAAARQLTAFSSKPNDRSEI